MDGYNAQNISFQQRIQHTFQTEPLKPPTDQSIGAVKPIFQQMPQIDLRNKDAATFLKGRMTIFGLIKHKVLSFLGKASELPKFERIAAGYKGQVQAYLLEQNRADLAEQLESVEIPDLPKHIRPRFRQAKAEQKVQRAVEKFFQQSIAKKQEKLSLRQTLDTTRAMAKEMGFALPEGRSLTGRFAGKEQLIGQGLSMLAYWKGENPEQVEQRLENLVSGKDSSISVQERQEALKQVSAAFEYLEEISNLTNRLETSATTDSDKIPELLRTGGQGFVLSTTVAGYQITEIFQKDFGRSEFIVNGALIEPKAGATMEDLFRALESAGASKQKIENALRFASQASQAEGVFAASHYVMEHHEGYMPNDLGNNTEVDCVRYRELIVDENGDVTVRLYRPFTLQGDPPNDTVVQVVQTFRFNADDYDTGEVTTEVAAFTPAEYDVYKATVRPS